MTEILEMTKPGLPRDWESIDEADQGTAFECPACAEKTVFRTHAATDLNLREFWAWCLHCGSLYKVQVFAVVDEVLHNDSGSSIPMPGKLRVERRLLDERIATTCYFPEVFSAGFQEPGASVVGAKIQIDWTERDGRQQTLENQATKYQRVSSSWWTRLKWLFGIHP